MRKATRVKNRRPKKPSLRTQLSEAQAENAKLKQERELLFQCLDGAVGLAKDIICRDAADTKYITEDYEAKINASNWSAVTHEMESRRRSLWSF